MNEDLDEFAPVNVRNPFRDVESRGRKDTGERARLKEVLMEGVKYSDKMYMKQKHANK